VLLSICSKPHQSRAIFFRGTGGITLPPPPKKHFGPPQAELFWAYYPKKTQKKIVKGYGGLCPNYQKKHSKNLIFGLVTSEIKERREVPFSKHFAAVFLENLFLQIFWVPT
jgi:hypothetical protein